MEKQSTHQKKPAPTRSHPTKTSVKSPLHPVEELQGAIGNREMGLLMETHPHIHPSSQNATMVGEMPMLGGMMPVSQGRIQRQPLFGGLSQEMRLENASLALPATGALVQRKLTLGTPGDMYEEEADRVARQVVDDIHSTPSRVQNAQSEEERIPAGGEAGRVQRQITVRSAGDAGGELSSEWEGELQGAKSGGQPLSPSVKEPMERAFGADFGGVRVHTGAQADGLARSIQAKAFTTGQDVFFRQGAYEPGSPGGKELIAHELTHVVQQSNDVSRQKLRPEKKQLPKAPAGKIQRDEIKYKNLDNTNKEEVEVVKKIALEVIELYRTIRNITPRLKETYKKAGLLEIGKGIGQAAISLATALSGIPAVTEGTNIATGTLMVNTGSATLGMTAGKKVADHGMSKMSAPEWKDMTQGMGEKATIMGRLKAFKDNKFGSISKAANTLLSLLPGVSAVKSMVKGGQILVQGKDKWEAQKSSVVRAVLETIDNMDAVILELLPNDFLDIKLQKSRKTIWFNKSVTVEQTLIKWKEEKEKFVTELEKWRSTNIESAALLDKFDDIFNDET